MTPEQRQDLRARMESDVRDYCELIVRKARDGRDPDPTKQGIFRDHRCWACNDGEKPCRQGSPNRCEYPHARND